MLASQPGLEAALAVVDGVHVLGVDCASPPCVVGTLAERRPSQRQDDGDWAEAVAGEIGTALTAMDGLSDDQVILVTPLRSGRALIVLAWNPFHRSHRARRHFIATAWARTRLGSICAWVQGRASEDMLPPLDQSLLDALRPERVEP